MRRSTCATVSLLASLALACGPGKGVTFGAGEESDGEVGSGSGASDGTEVTGVEEGTEESEDSTGGEETTGDAACPWGIHADWGADAPGIWPVSIRGTHDLMEGPCSDTAAPEFIARWRAPESRPYVFTTLDTTFDPVLHVYDAECDSVLNCDDDTYDEDAAVVVTLDAGQEVMVVVEGAAPGGDGVLQVHPAPVTAWECTQGDFPSELPASVSITNEEDQNYNASSCGGLYSPEHGWDFRAHWNGEYTFHTVGSTIETMISVRNGGCVGAELACARMNFDELGAVAKVRLEAGQQVTILVDAVNADVGTVMLTGAVEID